MSDLDRKRSRLYDNVSAYPSLLVAYSGGVDSALVLRVAGDVLGSNTLAITADSPSVPRSELARARTTARAFGVRHRVIRTAEIEDPRYAANTGDRCYFCKSELYSCLLEVARGEGIRHIANGTNLDDLGDHRPGLRAASEFEVVSPLADAGMNKSDVRALARELGLEIWDKPASPCLSSRVPYGRPVTVETLGAIEQAEAYLHGFGIRELRVRHFGTQARIETTPDDLPRIRARLDAIRRRFREIGFQAVELAEFRSGALNDALPMRDSRPGRDGG